jgi:hypothetical protein
MMVLLRKKPKFITQQSHSLDGEKRCGAGAARSLAPLVMHGIME